MYQMNDIKKLPALGAKAADAWKSFVAFDQAALADGAIPKKSSRKPCSSPQHCAQAAR